MAFEDRGDLSVVGRRAARRGAWSDRLPIGALGERRNLSPSGISRSVDRLTKAGLVQRVANPADARSLLVALTDDGLAKLRAARKSHHAIVRELLLSRLDAQDLVQLSNAWEKAMPGAVNSATWPVASQPGRLEQSAPGA